MPRFEVKQSSKLNLTSYSGLALIGACAAGMNYYRPITRKMYLFEIFKYDFSRRLIPMPFKLIEERVSQDRLTAYATIEINLDQATEGYVLRFTPNFDYNYYDQFIGSMYKSEPSQP